MLFDLPENVSVISLWQPWASLIFAPTQPKRHETRSWAFPLGLHRSRIGIHAAQKIVPAQSLPVELLELCCEYLGLAWQETVPRGGILGTVRLTGCVHTHMITPDDDDRVCGDWSPGRYAWELTHPRAIEGAFVPWKGRQGWFNVPRSAFPAEVLDG